MRERMVLLDDACQALIAGDPDASQLALDRFGAEVARKPLTPEERGITADYLGRLRDLAEASVTGIESARDWLRDLNKTLGGLDVYDRSGRQRLSTGLSGKPHRF